LDEMFRLLELDSTHLININQLSDRNVDCSHAIS
jgi:hypothetical protein